MSLYGLKLSLDSRVQPKPTFQLLGSAVLLDASCSRIGGVHALGSILFMFLPSSFFLCGFLLVYLIGFVFCFVLFFMGIAHCRV